MKYNAKYYVRGYRVPYFVYYLYLFLQRNQRGVVFYDDFTDSEGTELRDHALDTGTAWTRSAISDLHISADSRGNVIVEYAFDGEAHRIELYPLLMQLEASRQQGRG